MKKEKSKTEVVCNSVLLGLALVGLVWLLTVIYLTEDPLTIRFEVDDNMLQASENFEEGIKEMDYPDYVCCDEEGGGLDV